MSAADADEISDMIKQLKESCRLQPRCGYADGSGSIRALEAEPISGSPVKFMTH